MTNSNFEKALAQTLKNEGVIGNKTGYVNANSDAGGETNYGITIATARACGYKGKMCNLPFETAKEIYYREYWIKCNAHNVINFDIAFLLFDFAVNSGVKSAGKRLQTAINKQLGKNELKIDGIIGEKTITQLNVWCIFKKTFKDIFIAEILSYYTSLQNQQTGFAKNGAGWVNRVVKNIRFLAGV